MKRKDIDTRYKWDETLVLKNENEFFKYLDKIKENIQKLVDFKGKLSDKENLLNFLNLQESTEKLLNRIYLYAFMKKSVDNADSNALKLYNLATDANFEISEKLAFVEVELSKISDDKLKDFLSDSRFKNYDRMIYSIIRQKPHILSEKEEIILSQIGKFADFGDIFEPLDNVEIKFSSVKMPDGKLVKLNNASYSVLSKDKNREVRRQTHTNLHRGFSKFNLTLSQNYISYLKESEFFAKTYKFKSALDSALFNEEVDKNVVNLLIDSVHDSLPLFYRYCEAKRKMLDIPKINIYDMYAPSVEEVSFEKSYDEAIEIIKKAVSPMGTEYTSVLDRAKNERWIDALPSDGKHSGAFEISCDTGNPFVLTNYAPCYNEISTLAHELGHAMHSYYSDKYQPFSKRDYCIFVAEVASTVNELMLDRYFLKTSKDEKFKKYIVDSILQKYYSTIFRQTMFSEFEMEAHDTVRTGKPIAFDILNKMYAKLLRLYFGKNVEIGKYAKYEWSRIPHFYRSFYVYKYATGLICAIVISEKLTNEKGYFEKYKKFLSGGCSLDPVSLLKLADVDISKKETFDYAFKFYKELIEQYEK